MSEIVYFIIILFAYLLSIVVQKTGKRYFIALLIVFLTVVSGFRGVAVGIDTPNYYKHILMHFPFGWMFREEGFRLLSNGIMLVTNNPQQVIVICSFITNLLIIVRLWDFREECSFSFSVLLYLLIYFSNSMNIMRQYVAVAFVFFGTRYLKQRKYHIYILFLLAAFFFHRSSLLGIGYIAISLWSSFGRKQKKIFALPMLIVLTITIAYVSSYLSSDITSYLAQKVSNINIPFFYRLTVFLFVLFAEYYRNGFGIRLKNKETQMVSYNNIAVYYFIGILISSLSMFFSFVGRAGLYYMIYEIVFWGMMAKQSKNRRMNILIFLVLASYEFVLEFSRNASGLFPYSVFIYN